MQKQTCTPPMSDKTFMRTMVASILGIVLSMLALLSTTWAYFSESVNSQSNVIQAGHFVIKDPEISVYSENSPSASMTITSDSGRNSYTLMANNTDGSTYTYEVTISVDDMTVTEGYCVVEIDGKKYYHVFTKLLSDTPVSFRVSAAEVDTVQINAYWSIDKSGINEGNKLKNQSQPILTARATTNMGVATTLFSQLDAIATETEVKATSTQDIAIQSIYSAMEASMMPASDGVDTSGYMSVLGDEVAKATQIVYDVQQSSSNVRVLVESAKKALLTANLRELEKLLIDADQERSKVSEAANTADLISARIKAIIAAIEAAQNPAESTVVPVTGDVVSNPATAATQSMPVETTVVPAS